MTEPVGVTTQDLLAKIGQLVVENDVLRAQLEGLASEVEPPKDEAPDA